LRRTETGYAVARRLSPRLLGVCLFPDRPVPPDLRAVLARTRQRATGVPTAEARCSEALLEWLARVRGGGDRELPEGIQAAESWI